MEYKVIRALVAYANGRWEKHHIRIPVATAPEDFGEVALAELVLNMAEHLEKLDTEVLYVCPIEESDDTPAAVEPKLAYEIPFSLTDVASGDTTDGAVILDDQLSIWLAGFGSKDAKPGEGEIIYLEFDREEVTLHVWSDINDPEPTHSIDLAGAREMARKKRPAAETR